MIFIFGQLGDLPLLLELLVCLGLLVDLRLVLDFLREFQFFDVFFLFLLPVLKHLGLHFFFLPGVEPLSEFLFLLVRYFLLVAFEHLREMGGLLLAYHHTILVLDILYSLFIFSAELVGLMLLPRINIRQHIISCKIISSFVRLGPHSPCSMLMRCISILNLT